MAEHQHLWSSSNPGRLIILLDQSGSMTLPYEGNDNRTEFAAKALNRIIDTIIKKNLKHENGKEVYKERCFLSVIGYDSKVHDLLPTPKSDKDKKHFLKFLNDNPIRIKKVKKMVSDGAGGLTEIEYPMPIWVEPIKEDKWTDMKRAFELAKKLIEIWITENPTTEAPIILNISDGLPYYDEKSVSDCMSETEQVVSQIKSIHCPNEYVKIFNVMIGNGTKTEFPTSTNGLNNEAKFLYEISTELSDDDCEIAKNCGLNASKGSRGVIYQADGVSLIQFINFGSSQAGSVDAK